MPIMSCRITAIRMRSGSATCKASAIHATPATRAIERRGWMNGCGIDGLPLDQSHPMYQRERELAKRSPGGGRSNS